MDVPTYDTDDCGTPNWNARVTLLSLALACLASLAAWGWVRHVDRMEASAGERTQDMSAVSLKATS